ncbi:PA3371 family protein [Metapseudomonas otitidis]|uniref:PA3371 family protein n=1 Tax=Metapseudomonas otitidis TaxID=319939 RepID=UPI0013F68B1F|nr:PA3371 family protein [Pseudomonas otitidis]
MSKSALICLMVCVLCTVGLWLEPGETAWLAQALKIGLATSGGLLVLALLVGKRVKFDPVLR